MQGNRPLNSNVGVIPCDASFCFGMVKLIAFILEDGLITQHAKAMGHALGNKEHTMIVPCQFAHRILTIGRTALAYIYCDIKYTSLHTTYQLGLGIWGQLEMQATQHTTCAHALVVLHKRYIQPCLLGKLFCIETLEKVASAIAKDLGLYNQYTLYLWKNIAKLYIIKLDMQHAANP